MWEEEKRPRGLEMGKHRDTGGTERQGGRGQRVLGGTEIGRDRHADGRDKQGRGEEKGL